MKRKYNSHLGNTLLSLSEERIPMHMPGHKRNRELLGDALPYEIDLTEIDGSDDLHSMEDGGIIKELANSLAQLYGAKCAHPLVGGSSCGILSAVRTLTRPLDTVIVARNSHKSVYHALEVMSLRAEYILPRLDQSFGICTKVTAEDVKSAFVRSPHASLVIITSPSYEGVVSEVDEIAAVCHNHGARLLVDAAHGAHFGLHPSLPPFPKSADIVITSLHKTLPALTSTAAALVYDEALAPAMARNLSIFQTSSPSYILLTSIAEAVGLIQGRGEELFVSYRENVRETRERLSSMKMLSLVPNDDDGKLVISTRRAAQSGEELARMLREEFGIECEMAQSDYVLLMSTVADTRDNLCAVCDALLEIDTELASKPNVTPTVRASFITSLPPRELELFEAVWADSLPQGVSDSYIWAYPPGIPLIVPGEKLTDEIKTLISELKNSGISLKIVKST